MPHDSSTNDFRLGRRAFLGTHAGALGSLALAYLLGDERGGVAAESSRGGSPLAPRAGHHSARATSVICLFQHGGPSQMDLFDPKPELNKRHGQPYQGELEVHFHTKVGKVMGSPYKFARQGAAGIELADILPHTARVVDDLTIVRSMTTESVDHEAALRMFHSGKIFPGRPTLGAWVLYGLGSERQDLPAFVVLSDPGGLPIDGTRNWSSGFLPAIYQGTQFRPSGSPVFNLTPPADRSSAERQRQLDLLEAWNRSHLDRYPENSELSARLENFELAAKMQTSVPRALDIERETAETRALYGLDDPATADYGRRCLMARRLVEQGVRFVTVYLSGQPWDTHDKNAERLKGLCARTDRPSAALVHDLKRRGLLDSTIVLWTGEFGRLPVSQGADGRDHNRHAFSLWLAGGGFKAGYAHGATDDFGYRSVRDVVSVSDLHATLLHALGLDHQRLTYRHDGRDDSLTDAIVSKARVARELFA